MFVVRYSCRRFATLQALQYRDAWRMRGDVLTNFSDLPIEEDATGNSVKRFSEHKIQPDDSCCALCTVLACMHDEKAKNKFIRQSEACTSSDKPGTMLAFSEHFDSRLHSLRQARQFCCSCTISPNFPTPRRPSTPHGRAQSPSPR